VAEGWELATDVGFCANRAPVLPTYPQFGAIAFKHILPLKLDWWSEEVFASY
jgi:hypothetical protein